MTEPSRSVAILLCLVLGIVWPAGAHAEVPTELRQGGLTVGGSAKVVEIIDGDTVVLDDGREVRLVGIQAPKLPLGRRGFKAWPLGDEAKAALSELALKRQVMLAYGGRRMDRHGRVLAHLFGRDGAWIQGQMITRGMARVYSFFDNRAVVSDLLALERIARTARRGIWRLRFYAIRAPEDAERYLSGFELVQGRVRKVAVVRKRIYLNFGADWRNDFTITIPPRARALFDAAGVDLPGYEGRILRVRGWLKSLNGPMIEATHPEQMELVEE